MAFPTIPTAAAGRLLSNTQANTSGTRTFPSLSGLTKNSGDLLIAVVVAYQSAASAGAVFSNWLGGFTEFLDVGGPTGMSIGAAYKISTGSESGTFSVDQAGTVTGHAAMFVMSIPGAHPSIAPVGGAITTGTTSAADIASLNPATWGTLDTLWIAVGAAGETSTTGSWTGITSGVTNYTNFVNTGDSGDVTGAVEAAVAFRQLNAASEDPATFGVDVSNARNAAVLLAVCPAPTRVTLAVAQETNSPQAISGTVVPSLRNITLVTETDAVGTIVPLQTLPATVTASAQPISTQSGHNITTSTTTASAQALDVDKKVTITPAAETDTVLSRQKIITFVSETDSARPLTTAHNTFSITPVTETDLAGDIVELQPLPALVTASAQALTVTQSGLVLSPATSTASAQVLSFTQGGGHLIVAATETDLANQIVSLQPLPATVTASAQPLSVIYGGRNIAPALESDSARVIAPGAGINLPEWEATAPLPYNFRVAVGDLSTAVALTKTSGVGSNKTITPVATTDSAQALTTVRRVTVTLVGETSTAPALTHAKTIGITTSTTTASVVGLGFTQGGTNHLTIGAALDTSTATSIAILKEILITLGIVNTTNTARTVRAANRPSGGLALIDHDPDSGITLTDHSQVDDLALIDI